MGCVKSPSRNKNKTQWFTEPLGAEVVLWMSKLGGNFTVQVGAFYTDLLLLQKAVSLMRGESDMCLWVQGCIFRMQLEVALT